MTDWRKIEEVLVRFLRMSKFEVGDLCGSPWLAVHRSKFDSERTLLNLETMAKFLADELTTEN